MVTAKQLECLAFIEGYIDNHDGVSPSMREIAFALNISVGNAWRFVHSLHKRGRLSRTVSKHRGFELALHIEHTGKTVPTAPRESYYIWDDQLKALVRWP